LQIASALIAAADATAYTAAVRSPVRLDVTQADWTTMADASQFSILTFQRRPGLWRASISPKVSGVAAIKGQTMLGFVTEDDCDSEEAAETAARRAIKKL